MDAKGFGLVGSSQHNAATDGNRLAAQARIQKLLDRSIEGVEIGMEDGGGGFHFEQNENKRGRLSRQGAI
jgi:hypothetical protein